MGNGTLLGLNGGGLQKLSNAGSHLAYTSFVQAQNQLLNQRLLQHYSRLPSQMRGRTRPNPQQMLCAVNVYLVQVFNMWICFPNHCWITRAWQLMAAHRTAMTLSGAPHMPNVMSARHFISEKREPSKGNGGPWYTCGAMGRSGHSGHTLPQLR